MIIIGKPFIKTSDGNTYLKAKISDAKAGCEAECFYKVDKAYCDYLCAEVADAFVVGLLLPAIASGQDIIVEAPISEKLYYNLHHTVIFAMSQAFNGTDIKVIPEKLIIPQIEPWAVGTGCSLGVDSFSTMLDHLSDECPESYKLTHLAYFNVGAHGDKDSAGARTAYLNDLKMVREFADEVKLPLIAMDSNLPEFYRHGNFDFRQTCLTRNMSMVLALQKLFKRYIYSSSYPVTEVKLSSKSISSMETVLLPALSTEKTELIVGDPNLSRTGKIGMICKNTLVRKHLYVCLRDSVINNNMYCGPWINKNVHEKRNCSRCDKCLRTLLILDILDELDNYSELFDSFAPKTLRLFYMAKILGTKSRNYGSDDLYRFAVKKKYKISVWAWVLSVLYRFRLNDAYYSIAKILNLNNN